MSTPTVFISYCHKDAIFKDRLVKHLGVLEREGLLDVWDDTRIGAGDDWYPQIQHAMSQAHVAVLLVSASFLTSDFILNEEVPRLLQRRADQDLHIFPVIVWPSDWKHVAWLADVQVRPKDGIPLSAGTEHEQEERLAEIAAEIADIIQKARGPVVGRQSVLRDLAEDLQHAFEIFNCDCEGRGAQAGEYYDWIVSIPGTPSNKRFLVRALAGEVGRAEVSNFRRDVRRLRVREGWLVSTRRASRLLRGGLVADRHRGVCCYTLEEVYEELADFEGHFKCLEEEIKRQRVAELFLPLACTRQKIDARTGEITASDRYPDVEQYVDRWLDDRAPDQLSVLGEFGTGKSWFALHYAWRQLKAYREARSRGTRRPRIPLLVPLRSYAEGGGLEGLFCEVLFPEHHIAGLSFQAFEKLSRMGRFLIIYDGFDEMSSRPKPEELPKEARADLHEQAREEVRRDFREIARTVWPGSKVILTSRTERFPDPLEAHLLFSGGFAYGSPPFEVVELDRLTESQIREILHRQGATEQFTNAVMGCEDLARLASRPLMIAHIAEVQSDIQADLRAGRTVNMSRVLLHAIRRKMSEYLDATTARRRGPLKSLGDQLYVLCELSWELVAKRPMELRFAELPAHLKHFLGRAPRESSALRRWAHAMHDLGVLVYDQAGNYSFAHRSLAEFFAAYKLVAGLGVLDSDFTDLVRERSRDKAANGAGKGRTNDSHQGADYAWSEYFGRRKANQRRRKARLAFRDFKPDDEPSSQRIGDTHAVNILSPTALTLAAGMVSREDKTLHRLTTMCWERTGPWAWSALSILPLLKDEFAERFAADLVTQSKDRPLPHGVPWVLGELGVSTAAVKKALLRNTVKALAAGKDVSEEAWWEAAFALEKLQYREALGKRRGDGPIRLLGDNLPTDYETYTYEQARDEIAAALAAKDKDKVKISRCAVVAIVRHGIDGPRLYREVLRKTRFANDVTRLRCYNVVWLCGHLRIPESWQGLVDATQNPMNSIRNCACEALGKLGEDLDDEPRPKVIRTLERCLRGQYYRTRFHAAWSLGELKSVGSIPRLMTAIANEHINYVRQHMERVVATLRKLAQSITNS